MPATASASGGEPLRCTPIAATRLPREEKLVSILTHHVVAGQVMAADVVKLKEAKTVQGSEVKIVVKDGKVKVNDANVTKTDIKCKNGVIHVIDAVIIPK